MAKRQKNFTANKAIIISITAHAIVLGAFCFITFTQADVRPKPLDTPEARVERIKRIVKSQPVIPKPTVKKRRFSKIQTPKRNFASHSLVTKHNSTVLSRDDSEPAVIFRNTGDLGLSDIEFFGNKAVAGSICFVVDGSGSMMGLLHSVKKQLKASIQSLGPDNYFYLIVFSGKGLITTPRPNMVRAAPLAVSKSIEMVEQLPLPTGSPDAFSALKRAFELTTPNGAKTDVVYFLTDGFDYSETENTSFAARVEQLRQRLAPNTRLHTIGFWAGSDDSKMLKAMADASGGEFINYTGKD